MNRSSHTATWTQIIAAEIEAFRRRTATSREAFAQMVVQGWADAGGPQIGREWKTDGDIFERGRVNAQRLYRWLDDVTKDNNLLPANVVPAILHTLPEESRVRVINAQLASLGMMVERVPAAQQAHRLALNQLLAADIKEASEAHQALVTLAVEPTPQNIAAARQELVESIAASTAALHHVDQIGKGAANG